MILMYLWKTRFLYVHMIVKGKNQVAVGCFIEKNRISRLNARVESKPGSMDAMDVDLH